MGDEAGEEKPFVVDRAKTGRAACKKCKQKCAANELRIAKVVASPYGEGTMKSWFHVDCIFEQFQKQRANTKHIESPDDIDGWHLLHTDDQRTIGEKWAAFEEQRCQKVKIDFVDTFKTHRGKVPKSPVNVVDDGSNNKDNLFREFRRLIADITNESSYTEKTRIVHQLFHKKGGFKSDVLLWCRLLLPVVTNRIYNLQSRQLVKLFAHILGADQTEMLAHLQEGGDIGETIQHFHEASDVCAPAKKSQLTLPEVDDFLERLSTLTREKDQIEHFRTLMPQCTANDLKIIVRLIKHDLRMNAGAKHILDAVHEGAYASYQSTRDLRVVIERCLSADASASGSTAVSKDIQLLTPVRPMLAEPCKSIEQAMKRCPNGMCAEIKYDGERVQLHKKGGDFRFFSRSLKPVAAHKVAHFDAHIAKAFPHAHSLILDCEILMVDTATGKPLPFGTLGKHKRAGYQTAVVCLFVFDCLYFNGRQLTREPLQTRKQILRDQMTPIEHRIVFSEMKRIDQPKQLADMITHVLKMGLEGLVLKDVDSIYEPGLRHWLKVKKDYLFDGAIADAADLIVLGAWYGTGKKGGIMSVFLMGVYDVQARCYKTVTKVHTGHDDKTLDRLQGELAMQKISGDPNKVPQWLKCTRTMVPDFVAIDPEAQPVWEVTGAEFTRQHDVHTANGISIRFPRVTRIRDDKTAADATSLMELEKLFETSKENFDGSLFNKELETLDSNEAVKTETRKRKKHHGTSKGALDVKKERMNFIDPLPSYFDGVVVMLADEDMRQKHAYLLRVFIGYSGTLLRADECVGATHVLHDSDKIAIDSINRAIDKSAYHVNTKWLSDAMQAGHLLEINSYLVKLLPA